MNEPVFSPYFFPELTWGVLLAITGAVAIALSLADAVWKANAAYRRTGGDPK